MRNKSTIRIIFYERSVPKRLELCLSSLLSRIPGDPLGFNKYLKIQNEIMEYVQRKIDAHVATLDATNRRDYVDTFPY